MLRDKAVTSSSEFANCMAQLGELARGVLAKNLEASCQREVQIAQYARFPSSTLLIIHGRQAASRSTLHGY
jgi:hypothetical protein